MWLNLTPDWFARPFRILFTWMLDSTAHKLEGQHNHCYQSVNSLCL